MSFWHNKKVFITGHTGFKGAWLSIWLSRLGANVVGYSLEPPTSPSIFELSNLNLKMESYIGNICDLPKIQKVMQDSEPEVIFHMAAQPLVRLSYSEPVATYATNVMGTVNVLESIRNTPSVKAVVIVTTDKCYENKEWYWGYRENESMGGFDPYSSSKGCAELVTASYRNSFFNINTYGKDHKVAIASARAGNVIGGGDWAKDRLIPDCIKAIVGGKDIIIRNPSSIRPWQHVLEPLNGYLSLAHALYSEGPNYAEAWNFGPEESDAKPVDYIVNCMCNEWGEGANYKVNLDPNQLHEAKYLKLDCSKARARLKWSPVWSLDQAISSIIAWNKGLVNGENAYDLCINDIEKFQADKKAKFNE